MIPETKPLPEIICQGFHLDVVNDEPIYGQKYIAALFRLVGAWLDENNINDYRVVSVDFTQQDDDEGDPMSFIVRLYYLQPTGSETK